MEKGILTENKVKEVLNRILNEETSKVKRDDYNRIQFKIEELQNSLNDTIREFRKMEDSIPGGLKTVTNGRISGISSNLMETQKLISQLKDKLKQHKRNSFSQQVDEKKNGK
jgi:predicted  nucleic acid-binding Zn-ribbon protein